MNEANESTTFTCHGSCLCGAVKFEVDMEIAAASHCHCSMCRKWHGAAFATYATAPADRFSITQGADMLRSYESSPGITRSFCGRCGSSLLWQRDAKNIDFALGALDTPVNAPRQWHIFVSSKAPWWNITDGLPQHQQNSNSP